MKASGVVADALAAVASKLSCGATFLMYSPVWAIAEIAATPPSMMPVTLPHRLCGNAGWTCVFSADDAVELWKPSIDPYR